VYLETGCGKTHIAVMLLEHIAPAIRKPSTRFAVFLCPTVYLVLQVLSFSPPASPSATHRVAHFSLELHFSSSSSSILCWT
jgi:ERCC4-related helicase